MVFNYTPYSLTFLNINARLVNLYWRIVKLHSCL